MKLVPILVALVGAAAAVYAWETGRFDSNGKFLGIAEHKDGFGVEEFLIGGFVLAGGAAAGYAAHRFLGVGTPVVKAA